MSGEWCDRIYGNMGLVKTTIEIPDSLFRETKARAALRGESLKDFVCDAIASRLQEKNGGERPEPGWRKFFGCADPADIAEIDAAIESEFGTVDPADWKD